MIACIFDIDGTLIDSVDAHAAAWQQAFAHFGKQISFADVRKQIGKGSDQLLPVFFSNPELADFGEDLKKWRGDLFKREYLSSLQPFPAVRELFLRLKNDGKRIALASSAKADENEVHRTLSAVYLRSYF